MLQMNAMTNQVYTMAVNEARLGGHAFLTPSHFLYAMLLFEQGRHLVRGSGGIVSKISHDVSEFLGKMGHSNPPENPMKSVEFEDFMMRADSYANDAFKSEIELEDALLALLSMNYTFAQEVLYRYGATFDGFDAYLFESVRGRAISAKDEDVVECPPDCDCKKPKPAHEMASKKKPEDYLKAFAINMVEKAQKGDYDPLVGRKDVLEEIILLLSRRGKNNPVLVGDGGVGKTAILEGLATYIATGDVPKSLKNAALYHLDMGLLVAGAKYRGDFEERLIGVLEGAKAQENPIICIDEIHTIVGAGSASGNTLDASNMLKPYLSRGELRFIGTTTFEDYKKHIEKSPSLMRRFHKIDIEEPTVAETIDILQGIVVNFTKHHKVIYDPKAIEASAKLTHKYLKQACLPDKAIDALDIAGAVVAKKSKFDFATVGVADVEQAVAKMAKIPETEVSTSEIQILASLEEKVKQQVFGQDEAVAAVAKAIKAARLGLNDPQKPVANLLFVGPTGVGKTEIARTFADVLGMKLIRFDMSEYQESHSTSRLVGAAPGYIGHDEGGLLVDAVRKNPSAVLLLDEIEKAHPNIFNMLLQVMDYGVLTDSQGKKADFRNILLVMTSNAGAASADKNIIGFGDKKDTTAMMAQVEKTFAPEFRNRLTKIVKFNQITMDIAVLIAKKAVNILAERIAERGIKIETEPKVLVHIAKTNFSATFGAREIIRYVDGELKDQIVDAMLTDKNISHIHISEENGIVQATPQNLVVEQEVACKESQQTAKLVEDMLNAN